MVAADGTIFSKGGLITGGLSQGNRERAEQWHAKDNDREKTVKQVRMTDMHCVVGRHPRISNTIIPNTAHRGRWG